MKKEPQVVWRTDEGVDVMLQQREGKITLRSHEVENLPPLEKVRFVERLRAIL